MFLKRKPWRKRKVNLYVHRAYHNTAYHRTAEPDPTFGIAWLPNAVHPNHGYAMKHSRKSWSKGWSVFK